MRQQLASVRLHMLGWEKGGTRTDTPIETLTTCNRLPESMYCPTKGAKMIAESPRANAYADIGSRVPGKMLAKYMTAPNSKTRAFHVERKCEI